MIHIRGRGLRSNSDLIVGLPGETLKSHVDAIHKLIDAGTNQMHNLQLVLLKGSELEKVDTRKEFRFDTRFRVLPKNFGVYGGDKVLDIEEIVVSTDTMSFDDYVETRKYHLVSSVFWNDSWFDEAVTFSQRMGMKRSQWFDAMLPALEASSGPARAFLDRFVGETVGELFPTMESCAEFYKRDENFQRLLNGDIGDNLMYKYRAMASFHTWPDICAVAMNATRKLVESSGHLYETPSFDDFWRDFQTYMQAKHADGRTVEEIISPIQVQLSFDIPSWIKDGMPLEFEQYRLARSEPFLFSLTEEGARELRAALSVWTCTLKGLTKMVTRIRMSWQVRRAERLWESRPMALAAAATSVGGGLLPDQW
jgi:hypothetical protein